MSNKRRKRIGGEKIKRNLLVRICRTAKRRGDPLPGYGANAASSTRDRLRDDVEQLVAPYLFGRS